MRKHRWIICLLLTTALLLTACGQTVSSGPATQLQSNDMEIMNEAYSNAVSSAFDPIAVSHGEDYVIEWEDEGMEAHIRFLLDKPDGDILHSDVWDVQFLGIFPNNGYPHDIMLTEPPEGWEHFESDALFLVENKEGVWNEYEGKKFAPIENLRDLHHFDCLQVFQTALSSVDAVPMDLSGVEQCPNLYRLILTGSKPITLEPLSRMTWLEDLGLHSCGPVDLTPLEGLPVLQSLSLSACEMDSLEVLTTLPSLSKLRLDNDAVYPSLEPLTRTSVAYLQMGLSKDGRGQYDYLDYESLARIPNLTWLDIMNHTAFGVEDCTALLEGCPNLKYLNIWYTGAAEAIAAGDYEPDSSHLEAFTTKPY